MKNLQWEVKIEPLITYWRRLFADKVRRPGWLALAPVLFISPTAVMTTINYARVYRELTASVLSRKEGVIGAIPGAET